MKSVIIMKNENNNEMIIMKNENERIMKMIVMKWIMA